MSAIEKFKRLLELFDRKSKVKITTTWGATYRCRLDNPAEDDDDWAFNLTTPDYPTKYFMLKCDDMTTIEELDETQWRAAWLRKDA